MATNGIISAQDLPMEKQYVDDGFPTDFPVVAPFLADIDTSRGRGQIYYRVTETPSVLNRVAQVCLSTETTEINSNCMIVDWLDACVVLVRGRKRLALHVQMNTFCTLLNYRSGFFLFPVCHPLVQSIVHSIFPFLFLLLTLHHSFIHSSDHPGSTSRIPRCKIHTHTCCGRYMGERRGLWGADQNSWAIKQGKMDREYWFMNEWVHSVT